MGRLEVGLGEAVEAGAIPERQAPSHPATTRSAHLPVCPSQLLLFEYQVGLQVIRSSYNYCGLMTWLITHEIGVAWFNGNVLAAMQPLAFQVVRIGAPLLCFRCIRCLSLGTRVERMAPTNAACGTCGLFEVIDVRLLIQCSNIVKFFSVYGRGPSQNKILRGID